MRKVLSFSAFLMMGLLVSQILPGAVGEGYTTIKSVSDVLLYICLSFIMINVGRDCPGAETGCSRPEYPPPGCRKGRRACPQVRA